MGSLPEIHRVGASSAGSPDCQRGAVDQHTCEAGGGWVHIRGPGPAANAPRCTVHDPFGTEVPFLSQSPFYLVPFPPRPLSLSFCPTVVVNLRLEGASHRPPDRHNGRTTGRGRLGRAPGSQRDTGHGQERGSAGGGGGGGGAATWEGLWCVSII